MTSRRAFLASFLAPLRAADKDDGHGGLSARGLETGPSAANTKPVAEAPAPPLVAIVQGRFCLAYQNSFCSTCVERCPVTGAITTERGLPRVNPDLCTGCRICHDVCPAPRNAILMIPRRPGHSTQNPSSSYSFSAMGNRPPS